MLTINAKYRNTRTYYAIKDLIFMVCVKHKNASFNQKADAINSVLTLLEYIKHLEYEKCYYFLTDRYYFRLQDCYGSKAFITLGR